MPLQLFVYCTSMLYAFNDCLIKFYSEINIDLFHEIEYSLYNSVSASCGIKLHNIIIE